MAGSAAMALARLVAQGQGHERSGGAGGAGLDHAGVGHGHQGERRRSTCRWASSPDEPSRGRTGRRDGGLRLHGRGPLPGLADGRAVLRPAAAAGHGRALRPRRGEGEGGGREKLGLAVGRDRLAGPARAATTCSSSTSARPATRTPRSRSRPWTPASTCCARSRWRTPSPRRARWSPRPSGPRAAGCAAWSATATAGCRRWRWPGGWWSRAGSARSGTCARSTCRTGSSTPSSRWCGGCSGARRGRARSATSARTSSTWRSTSSVTCSPGVSALTETFVRERPLPPIGGRSASWSAPPAAPRRGPSTSTTRRCSSAASPAGAVASFEATRFATGRKNALRIELNGSRGSLAFDQERMNELEFYDGAEDPDTAGFRRILVTEPTHPYAGAWWPPGHGLGYEHSFTHQVVDLVTGHRRRAATRCRRSRTGCGCSWCWTPSSGRPSAGALARRCRGGARWRDRSRLFTGQWADLPFEEVAPAGGGVGLRRAGDRLLGRPLRPVGGRRGRRLRRGPPRDPGQARPAGLRDLQPPHRAGRLRRPDRRAAPRHPARPRSGATASRRACGSARPRRCRMTARAAAALGVRHGRRVHRVEDLEDRGDVPAGAASR